MPDAADDAELARKEANRLLRIQYTTDPSKLSEDEQTRAMVLLQRDARKLRQQSSAISGKAGPGGIKTMVIGPASGHLLRQKQRESKEDSATPRETPSETVPTPPGLSTAEVEVWKKKSEANRVLRERYVRDPSSLSEDEIAKALVLLQRDQRKLRQAAKAKKENVNKIATADGRMAGDAKASMEAAKKAPREGSSWAPQADASAIRQNELLRVKLSEAPNSLSDVDRERAEILLKRDQRRSANTHPPRCI